VHIDWVYLPQILNHCPPGIEPLFKGEVSRSDAMILLYDVTNPESLKGIKALHRVVRGIKTNGMYQHTPPSKKPVIIMANKCYIPEKDWAVAKKKGKQYSERNGATMFVQVSAKTGAGLEKDILFGEILDYICRARSEEHSDVEEETGQNGIMGLIRAKIKRFLTRITGQRNN
jgi:50S ribosomal subunit-associated GTPase HflX